MTILPSGRSGAPSKLLRLLAVAVFGLVALGGGITANAGWKPDGQLTLQIGFGAGGSTERLAACWPRL